VPMVHESFVRYGKMKSIVNWSRMKSDEQKIIESRECSKLYESILVALQKYM